MRVQKNQFFFGLELTRAGDSLPTIDNLYALSRLFGTSVDDILRGSREEDESPSLPAYRDFYETKLAG